MEAKIFGDWDLQEGTPIPGTTLRVCNSNIPLEHKSLIIVFAKT
jgi:hypothetical protein